MKNNSFYYGMLPQDVIWKNKHKKLNKTSLLLLLQLVSKIYRSNNNKCVWKNNSNFRLFIQEGQYFYTYKKISNDLNITYKAARNAIKSLIKKEIIFFQNVKHKNAHIGFILGFVAEKKGADLKKEIQVQKFEENNKKGQTFKGFRADPPIKKGQTLQKFNDIEFCEEKHSKPLNSIHDIFIKLREKGRPTIKKGQTMLNKNNINKNNSFSVTGEDLNNVKNKVYTN